MAEPLDKSAGAGTARDAHGALGPRFFQALKRSSRHAPPILFALALILPLLVASIALYDEDWAPIYDMALIEQRVRDVGTARTPLLGLPGRLGTVQEPASHPGPLSFFLLAPVYRLVGGSAWALQVSAAFVNALAVSVAVAIAWRRRSIAVVAAVSLGLALLIQGYGLSLLTEPWNPNFPVLWFAAFLVAVWSVAVDDLDMLPVVVATASICAQTHIPYVAVCGAFGVLAVGLAVRATLRMRRASRERRHAVRLLVASPALGLALWLPPLIEEMRGDPGNITRLVRYFGDTANPVTGIGQAVSVVLPRFDAWHVSIDQLVTPGGFNTHWLVASHARVIVSLAVWLLCAIGALVLRNKALIALHMLVLAGLGVALLATSRIIGFPFAHVMFWSWGLAAWCVVSSLVTTAAAVVRFCPASMKLRLARVAGSLLVLAVAAWTIRLALAARDVLPSSHRQTRQLRALANATIEAIERRAGLATGRSGRYLVSWWDSVHGGGLGIGLANELERAGYEVGYEPGLAPFANDRTRDMEWATARIHFASGGWIRKTRRIKGVVEVARSDVRSSAEKQEADALHEAVREAFRQAGRRDLVKKADYDLAGALAAEPSVGPLIALAAGRLTDLGGPAAVFVMSPHALTK